MIIINENLPQIETSDIDLFLNGTGTITGGSLDGQTYSTAALGTAIHGLNIDNQIKNSFDFPGSTYSYTGYKLVTNIPASTVSAWDGTQYITYTTRTEITQISGYRCSDFRVHKVPGIPNWTRTASDVDDTYKLKFKNYAVISGMDKYLYGFALGKNSFIFSSGVGNSFLVKFVSSSGSTTVTRKFTFTVDRFGVFGIPFSRQTIVVDSGSFDRSGTNSAPNANCMLTPACPTTAAYGFYLFDFSQDGSKCLIAMRPENNAGVESDGVNYLHGYPLAWAEFTLARTGSTVAITYDCIRQYATGTTNTKNIVDGRLGSSPAGALLNTDQTKLLRVRVSWACGSDDLTGLPYAPPGSYVAAGGAYTRVIKTNVSNATVSDTGTGPYARYQGNGVAFTLQQDIGQARFLSGSGQELNIRRLIHLCYVGNVLKEAWVLYESYSATIETTLEASVSGSCSWSLGNPGAGASWSSGNYLGNSGLSGPFYAAGGSVTLSYKLRRQSYNRKYFALEINGSVVDFISLDSTSGASDSEVIKTWSPYNNGTTSTYFGDLQTMRTSDSGTSTLGITVTSAGGFVSNGTSSNVVQPSIAGMGPFGSWSVGYQATNQADSIAEKIRNLAVATAGDPKSWVKPFVRIESNNLISFNIGDSGYSVGTTETTSGSSFPIRYQVLAAGTHFKRAVYKMDGGGLLVNTYDANPNPANPAFNVNGAYHRCSYNSETLEGVVNSEYDCTYV